MTPSPPPPEALLLDMDGTLVDSEPLWQIAEAALVSAHGHTLEPEVRRRLEGVSTPAAMALLREHYRLEPDIATLADQLESHLLTLLDDVQAMPGAEALVRWAAASALPFAVVSNSSHRVIAGALALQPWAGLVAAERRFSADDVAEGKPAPDLYLHAAEALGAAPERCLAVEDTLTGVRSALAAGMTAWAVPAAHADRAAFEAHTPHLFDDLDGVLTALRTWVGA